MYTFFVAILRKIYSIFSVAGKQDEFSLPIVYIKIFISLVVLDCNLNQSSIDSE